MTIEFTDEEKRTILEKVGWTCQTDGFSHEYWIVPTKDKSNIPIQCNLSGAWYRLCYYISDEFLQSLLKV